MRRLEVVVQAYSTMSLWIIDDQPGRVISMNCDTAPSNMGHQSLNSSIFFVPCEALVPKLLVASFCGSPSSVLAPGSDALCS